MRHSLVALLYALFCFSCIVADSSRVSADPLLVIVLMVKNEESVMADTLQPFADAGINAFLILDTGSTDKTIAATEEFFKQQGITQGVIKEKPFVNFATSRNHALAYAEEAFPTAGFFLMLDAEWKLNNVPGLLRFCKEHIVDREDAYSVLISSSNEDFYTQRLIRPRRGVHFVGAVHECLDRVSDIMVPNDVFFQLCTTHAGYEKTKARWVRDCALLLKEYERNPNDPRTVFYLAQTYACLGDLENARIFYMRRCALPGWDEENFMAYYRLGLVYEAENDWNHALLSFLQAYSMRPSRVEPLIKIAQHYLKERNFELSYLFAHRALDKPYPARDYLFVEKDIYNFVRYDLVGIASWYIGEYVIGESAVRRALTVQPNAPHLHANLLLYVHRCLL